MVERLLGFIYIRPVSGKLLPVSSDFYPYPPNHQVALNNDENQDEKANKGEEFECVHCINFVEFTKKGKRLH